MSSTRTPASERTRGAEQLGALHHVLDDDDEPLDLLLLILWRPSTTAQGSKGFHHIGRSVRKSVVRCVGGKQNRERSERAALTPSIDEPGQWAVDRMFFVCPIRQVCRARVANNYRSALSCHSVPVCCRHVSAGHSAWPT